MIKMQSASLLLSAVLLCVVSSYGVERRHLGNMPAATLIAAATAKSSQESVVVLNDGVSFPLVSFGLQIYGDERARELTSIALECGYRNFFASVLAGNQRGFAKAVRESGIDRSEIFVCGSVLSNRAQGYEAALRSTRRGCDENLEALGGKLDMIMLDYPGPDRDSVRGQWAGLEEMKQKGLTKSIAVSNFTPEQLDWCSSPPSVNQLPFGVGYKTEKNARLLKENRDRGVLVQAWSPLRVVSGRAKSECADIGKGYGKSAQQVALKWIVQKGAAFTAQTTSKAHFQENIDIFDFELSSEEIRRLDALV